MPLNRMRFMNTYIDNVDINMTIQYVEECINKRKIVQITTLNSDHIVKIESDPFLKKVCDESDLNLADGHRLISIAKKYKTPLKEKICGSDLVPTLCKLSQDKGYSIFLLGAAEGVADLAARNLKKQYPNLIIAGSYSPPFGFESDPTELDKINKILLNSKADMVFVAFGVPKQEIFIYNNKDKYQIPISINVGGTIDFIAGVQKRAPRWVNRIGMEWFYRFLHNPKRLFKRYFIDDMKIFKLARKYKPNKKGN